ncbi:MAG: indole-3-glycerol phosphate synthase TrpC [Nitrospirae bacterium]|nr:indole-3-glycerol phosphate synthase TrpC [Candidatus Manganitrophaceae bacterium]
MNLLDQVVAQKREDIQSRKGRDYLRETRARASDAGQTRGFTAALAQKIGNFPNLIAEVKKASPSKGVIREDFHPLEIAQIYEAGGAAALSVLTEEHYFLGRPIYLSEIRAKVALPLLQKDFILDELQVYEARAWGADAILLIVALLAPSQIRDYFDLAKELSLDVLVEVHTEAELEKVIEWAPLIGINNRDLNTFETKLETTFRLRKTIPSDRTIVSESGIRTRGELEILAEANVDAVLIGETLMASKDISAKMKELFAS